MTGEAENTTQDGGRASARPQGAVKSGKARTGRLKVAGRSIWLPRSPIARRLLGGLLVAGGILGFLPVLGFWMLPLGLVLLSQDSPKLRRLRRRLAVKLGRRKHG